MSATARPLIIHPWPVADADMALVRAAFERLAPPFPVLPQRAVPGSVARILALREPPPFTGDHMLVRDPGNAHGLQMALWWVLDETRDDERATLVIHQLDAWLGGGVREIIPEPVVDDGRRSLDDLVDPIYG